MRSRAIQIVIDLTAHRWVDVIAAEVGGCHPSNIAGFLVHRWRPTNRSRQQRDLVFLPDLAVRVGHDVRGIRIDHTSCQYSTLPISDLPAILNGRTYRAHEAVLSRSWTSMVAPTTTEFQDLPHRHARRRPTQQPDQKGNGSMDHPLWCDAERCTADQPGGVHASDDMTLVNDMHLSLTESPTPGPRAVITIAALVSPDPDGPTSASSSPPSTLARSPPD